ncbi:MAG: BamA/TamA family outer membrane protein, partial [Candidatus Latescibacteria bacterium]|nr:BamA/TamA family outer membrane protein [Candidatus Latescibacterota bacterium]
DHYNSLMNTTDWSLFGNRWGGLAYFRSNPAIDQGQMRSVQGTVRLDTRNSFRKSHRGWFMTLSGEKAGGILQGKYNFERYQFDVRRYQPLFNGTGLDARVHFGTGRGTLPRQFQYAIGGSGSVHGYDYKAIRGDRMALFNIAYWVDGEQHFGRDWPLDDVSIGAFFDAGAAWFAQDVNDVFDGVESLDHIVKRSAGVAFALDDFHAYFARPLDSADTSWRVWVRFSRAF